MNSFQGGGRKFTKLVEDILKVINANDNFVILPHINPDGDAIGSSVALRRFLINIGKNAEIVTCSSVPVYLEFLAKDYFKSPEKLKRIQTSGNWNSYGVFVLDSGDLMRIEDRKEIFDGGSTTVNIDHHVTNTEFAHINAVYTKISSTGELLFEIVCALFRMDENIRSKAKFDIESLNAFYASILSDTGGFRYSNTSPNTMKVAYKLLELGAEAADLGVRLFQTKPMSTYRAMKMALENMRMFCNDKVALSYFTLEGMEERNISNDDIDGMVEMLRDIDTVEVSVVLKQTEENLFKVSMRSKRYVDLTKIAVLFDGGGHMRASGCKVEGNLEDGITSLINAISGEV